MQLKTNNVLFGTLTAGALVLGLSFITACSNNDSSSGNNNTPRVGQLNDPGTHTVTVLPYKATCVRTTEQLCFVVHTDGSNANELVYDDIQGLNWRWGETITAKITTTEIPNAPQSGPNRTFQVTQMVSHSEAAPGTTFTMDLNNHFVGAANNCSFTLLSGTPDAQTFHAKDQATCTLFNGALNTGSTYRSTFAFMNSSSLPIELQSVGPVVPAPAPAPTPAPSATPAPSPSPSPSATPVGTPVPSPTATPAH